MTARADVEFRLATDDWASEGFTVTTGSVPATLPRFTVIDEGDPGVNYIAGSYLITADEGSAVWVVNRDGEVVWYQVLEGIGTVPVIHKVDGGFLYLVTSHGHLGEAHVRWVINDGRKQDVYALPMAHHDVIEVPGVQFAAVVGEARVVDGQDVVGDGIVEMLDDGSTRVVWTTFDHFEVQENDGWGTLAYPEGADWNHASGLDDDAATDDYLFSMYRCECTASINRSSGATNWVLGDVDVQPDGGHLSSWGTLGEIVSTGPDDAIRWRVDIDPGHVLGQVEGFGGFE